LLESSLTGTSFASRFAALLQENELFASLSDDEVKRLAPLCSDFAAVEGSVLFREGRAASRLFLVTDGQIALRKGIRSPLGKRWRHTTVAVCRPGEAVGWSALVQPYRHPLSAVAWESSRLLRIDAKIVRKMLDSSPELENKVMKALSMVAAHRLTQMAEALGRELSYATMRS
jgi:CRP/FNR family cyclic AMP-dependent transcriptional regulator